MAGAVAAQRFEVRQASSQEVEYVSGKGDRDHGDIRHEFRGRDQPGIGKASETVRGIKGAWVKEQKILIENGAVSGYRVDLKVTFVLE